jgi:hypothetical protein
MAHGLVKSGWSKSAVCIQSHCILKIAQPCTLFPSTAAQVRCPMPLLLKNINALPPTSRHEPEFRSVRLDSYKFPSPLGDIARLLLRPSPINTVSWDFSGVSTDCEPAPLWSGCVCRLVFAGAAGQL